MMSRTIRLQVFWTLVGVGLLQAGSVLAKPSRWSTEGIGLSPDGTRVYVTDSPSGSLVVLGTADHRVLATIKLPQRFSLPLFGAVVSPDGRRVYVAKQDDDEVAVIDTAANAVIGTIKVTDGPEGIAVNGDGSRIYVTRGSSSSASSVAVVDPASNQVVGALNGGAFPPRLALSPDSTRAYVTNGSFGSPSLRVLNAADGRLIATVPLDAYAWGVAAASDGRRVYVACTGADDVVAFDPTDNRVLAKVKVGKWPRDVALTPDGSRLYVSCAGSASVAVLNTRENRVEATIPVAAVPGALAVTPDGRRVFVVHQHDNRRPETGRVTVISGETNAVEAVVTFAAAPTGAQ